MNTSQLTKLDDKLRDELAEYGLVRAAAVKEAPVRKGKPNFFAMQDRGSEVELVFSDDEKVLADEIDDGKILSLVAPENEPFDMLVTRDFQKAVTGKDPATLREFILRILDEA